MSDHPNSMTRRQAGLELALLLGVLLFHLWTDSRRVFPKNIRHLNTLILASVALGILVRQRPTRRELGFAPNGWTEGVASLGVGTLAAVGILWALGWKAGSVGTFPEMATWPFENFHQQLIQQILLQVILYPRCVLLLAERRGENGWKPVALAAAIFAIVHAPNLPLMLFSGLAALGWTAWFRLHPNLPAVWISHSLLAGTALWTIHPYLGRLRVGIGYLWSSRDLVP